MGSSFSIYCFTVLLWILCDAIISKFVKKKIYVLPVATYSYNLPRRLFKRPSIPKHIRSEVFRRDGYSCRHCGSGHKLQIDHKTPYSWTKDDRIENLQTLCQPCNLRKLNRFAG